MVNNVIGMVNYVIAARASLRNFMIADTAAAVPTGHCRALGTGLRAAGCAARRARGAHTCRRPAGLEGTARETAEPRPAGDGAPPRSRRAGTSRRSEERR